MAESADQQAPEKEKTKAGAEQAPPKKKKRILLLAIGVILFGVLGGGGFFAYKTFVKGKAPAAKPLDEASSAIEDVKSETKGPEGGHKEEESGKKEEGKKEEGKKEEGKKEEGKEGEGKEGGKEVSLFHNLSQVISTNLKGSPRRVMAQVWVEAADEDALKIIQKSEPYIQNELVLLFSGKTVEDVTSEDGKEMLLKEMKTRLDKLFEKNMIKKVGFSGINTY